MITKAEVVGDIAALLPASQPLDPYDLRMLMSMRMFQLFTVRRLMQRSLDAVAVRHARRVARILGSAEPVRKRSTARRRR